MDLISIGGNGVIAVSYGALESAKSSLKRSKTINEEVSMGIRAVEGKLEIDIGSSRIRAVEDNLESYCRRINRVQTSIDGMINKIDKIGKTCREVDSRCAAKIRGITAGSSVSSGSSIWSWFEEHPIVGNVIGALGDGIVIAGTIAAVVVAGPEVLGVAAVVGVVFAVNGLINEGVKIYNNVTS